MKMTKKTKMQRWIPSLIVAAAMAGTAGLCQAQLTITYNFNASLESWTDITGDSFNTVSWNATGGPDGSGCAEYTFANAGDTASPLTVEPGVVSPGISISTPAEYTTVNVDIKCSGGKTGTGGSGGYGNLQLFWQNPSYSWYSAWYGAVLNSGWQHYTFAFPAGTGPVQQLGFQLQGQSDGYSGPVTVDVDNVVIAPIANPYVVESFNNNSWVWQNYGASATWDTSQDAPYYNPVTGAGPTTITPAGSMEFQAPTPSGYPGGQLNLSFNPSLYQWAGVDIYYDGPTPSSSTDYGGFQMFIANGNSPYGWSWIGAHSFTAADLGTWVHYNFPCASSGLVNGAGFAIQATPGSGAGATPITIHFDNFQLWNPETLPQITGISPGTPGGVQITVDADGTLNLNDQEGFCTPSTNNTAENFFWLNQTPATYSMSLTDCPASTAAPSFDAHIYVWNGDSLVANGQGFGYNETYTGANWNVGDMISLDVANGTNGGVIASFGWKTNLFNGNIPAANVTNFIFGSMANANGTWALNFTDNTHGNITAPDGSVNSFTVPNFSSDPNYTANFAPATSAISFGVFKGGNVLNNGQSITMNNVKVANSTGTIYNDSFSGPGLDANNNWQVAEYYQYAADRTIWIPYGTAWWVKYNTTAGGWSVQSAPDLESWTGGLVTYTYVDATGTNTLGAIPSAGLPSADFFRLMHP